MAESTAMKLLLSYDVKPEHAQEYYQFVMGRYIPVMQALGVQMKDAWLTGYGSFPNRLIEFVSRDEETMRALLTNETWTSLNDHLQKYVTDFSYKVVPYREGFQF